MKKNNRSTFFHALYPILIAALTLSSGTTQAGPGKTLYLHGPVTIVTPVKNPNKYGEAVVFYHNDILGSPIATTDINGNLCWSEDYYPYGEKRLQEDGGNTDCGLSGSGNERGYTNHVFDNDINLTYAQARYYDQTIGRFYGMDPAGVDLDQSATFNRYAYGNNNPYKYTDPDGEAAVLAPLAPYAGPALGKLGGHIIGATIAFGAMVLGMNNEEGSTEDAAGTRTVDDLLGETTLENDTKGKSTIRNKDGSVGTEDEPFKDFDSLAPKDVQVKDTDKGKIKTGVLDDGRTVTAREFSTDGRPTLDIKDKNQRGTEIRYGPKQSGSAGQGSSGGNPHL